MKKGMGVVLLHAAVADLQIDRDRYGYDIELSNGTEIDFNKHLKVTKVAR